MKFGNFGGFFVCGVWWLYGWCMVELGFCGGFLEIVCWYLLGVFVCGGVVVDGGGGVGCL